MPIDVVQIAAVDRQARVAVRESTSTTIVARGASAGDGDDLGARHHHLAGGEIGEPEDAVEHLFLLLLEDARLLAGRHQHLQLFLRMHHRVAAGAAQPEQR